MESVELEVGEALFVNPRTIHASPPNLSLEDRIAVTIVLIPEVATLKHWVLDKTTSEFALELNVAPSFFTEYSCFDYPNVSNANKKVRLQTQKKSWIDILKY